MCDSLIGTLLNTLGKTKEDNSSHLNMVEMSIQQHLASEDRGKITYMPLTCHTI